MTARLLAVFAAAFLWAKMEEEIEGEHGWAESLPTWRIDNHPLLNLLMNGRPMTGYHLWAFSFIFFAFHLALIGAGSWSWRAECAALGSISLFWVLEDFIWFMVNPYFGWRRYRRQDVSWHRSWWLGLPADHWGLIAMSVIFLALSRRS